ncbi:uncharacterized protein LOC116604601 [Nematostella vectensis]|uniref:uncharacterized protein LOC116604601 n=1 Tax=Nematostella vectensis TaxID=45351 RepID=UPI00138FBAEA|nr:uncharacterized protein LOC116604601 [Nematostella vectensis]
MEIFESPYTDLSLEKGEYVSYSPSDKGRRHIEWRIDPLNQYFDPQRTHIRMVVKVTKANGNDLDADDTGIGFVNNIGPSLIKNASLELNGILVTLQTDSYPYKSVIKNLLSHGQESQDSYLQCGGWHKDTAGHMEVHESEGDGATNKGFVERFGYSARSREFGLIIPLDLDTLQTDRYIVNHVGIKLRLELNRDEFVLMGGGTYTIAANPLLRLYQVTPLSSIGTDHNKAMKLATLAKYPVSTVVVKTRAVPQGVRLFTFDNLFNGMVPKRLVVGMVRHAAFTGDYTLNPFHFQFLGVEKVALRVDSNETPWKDIRHVGPEAIDEYHMLHVGVNGTALRKGLNISRHEFFNGYTLLVYDLTKPGNAGSGYIHPQYKGNTSLELTFTADTTQILTVVLYAEFDNNMEMDYMRRVMYNISA